MKALDYAKQICFSSEETLLFTYESAKTYQASDGVFVECGVAAGAQIIAMAEGAPDKTIYAFDSFQGIPLPSNKDDQYPGIRKIGREEQQSLPDPGSQVLESSGATVYSVEQFWENIRKSEVNAENIITISGWFEETIWKMNTIDKIAILRLDGDLYHSTMVCLKNLYPQVIPMGLVIIDDWNLAGCRQAVRDYFGHQMPEMKFVSTIAYFYK